MSTKNTESKPKNKKNEKQLKIKKEKTPFIWIFYALYCIIAALIVATLVALIEYILAFNRCVSNQSKTCPVIQCPCNSSSSNATGSALSGCPDGKDPCNGAAIRNGADSGTFYCSTAPQTLVNCDGTVVS